MKIKSFVCLLLLLLFPGSNIRAIGIVEFILAYQAVPIAKTMLVGGTLFFAYVADRVINEPKREAKRQKKIADHQEYLNQVRNWSYEQFESRLKHLNIDGEFEAYSTEELFEQYSYYQFPQFQLLLQNQPSYEESILQIRNQIKHGKKFDLITEEEQQKFKEAVRVLAQEIDCRIAQREYEAQRYQEQLKQARLEKEKKARYQEHINKVLNVEHNALNKVYEDSANSMSFTDFDLQVQEALAKRQQALAQHFEGDDEWSAHTFHLTYDVIELLKEHGINAHSYNQFYGNQVQHALHKEVITILEQTAKMRTDNNFQEDTKSFTRSLTLFADAGQQHNHAGHLPKAMSLLDFCYEMLDVAQTLYKTTGQMYLEGVKLGYRCNMAALRGAWQGSKNYGNKLLALGKCCKDLVYKMVHPLETTRLVAPKIQKAAKRFGQYLVECSDAREKWRTQDHNPHLYYWHIRTNEEYLTIKQQRREWLDETIKDGHQMLKNTANFAYDAGLEGCIEKGSEVATEMGLSYITGKAVSSLAQAGASSFANILDELSELHYIHQMPTTMGTLQGYVVLEGTELARAATALRVLSDEFAVAGDALGKVGSASIAVHDIASVGNQGSMYTYPDPMEVAEATELARKELVRIQNLFKVQIQDIEKPIDPLVQALSTDKILNHILVLKHNFDRVLTNLKSEEGLRRLLSVVQDKGALRSFNKKK